MKTLILILFFVLNSFAQTQPSLPAVTLAPTNAPSIIDTYANIVSTTCNSVNKGQLGFTTDSIYTASCNGSSWQWYFRGVAVTPPPTTGWTLDSQSGSSISANADGTVTFYFTQQTGTNCCIDIAYRTGTALETITALVCSPFADLITGNSDIGNDTSIGLGFRDSGTKTAAQYWTESGAINGSPTFFTTIDYWTSRTVYSSTPSVYPSNYPDTSPALGPFITQDCKWMRVKEDSTNDTWSTNFVGSANNWTQFFQASKTDFLASGTHNPAIIGYVHGNGQRVVFVSWTATNP